MRLLAALLRQRARRDALQLALWLAGLAGLTAAATAAAVLDAFADEDDRREILAVAIATRTILIFRGTPNGVSDGAFAFFLLYAWIAMLGGLMAVLLAVRHTRGDEETGRAELIGATPAGRVLPLAATVLHGVLAQLGLAVLTAAGLVAAGLEPHGSLVFGAALGASGVAFLGIGLLAAQVFGTARAASGASIAVVLAAYLVRGIGDAAGSPSDDLVRVTPAWPSWLSPIGYGQLTGAYVENDLAPLTAPLACGVVLIALVFALQSARDQGASLLPDRGGRARGGRLLSSSLGLAWRLSLPVLAAWSAGAVVAGLLATTLTAAIDELSGDLPQVVELLQARMGAIGSIEVAFVALFFGMVGILAACCAVQAGLRARQEESRGTAEAILATPVPRVRWLAEYGLVGVAVTAVMLAAAAAAGAFGAARGDHAETLVPVVLEAAAAQPPACLTFLGVTMLLVAAAPRIAATVAWTLVGLSGVLGFFGPVLGLPETVVDLSPFAHTPVPVGDGAGWSGGLWLAIAGVVAAGAGLVAMRRRELATD